MSDKAVLIQLYRTVFAKFIAAVFQQVAREQRRQMPGFDSRVECELKFKINYLIPVLVMPLRNPVSDIFAITTYRSLYTNQNAAKKETAFG